MKFSFFQSILLAGLLGCCSGARAGNDSSRSPAMLPVQGSVEVKAVNGVVEYAYDCTGWRTLPAGKQLHAGATVRAGAGASAVLRVSERSALVKVSPATSLHITVQTPAEEIRTASLAAR